MRHEEGGFSAGSVLLSFLLGGMVGAGLALLLAPQSGVETRRKIRELTEEVKEKEEVKEEVEEIVEPKAEEKIEEKGGKVFTNALPQRVIISDDKIVGIEVLMELQKNYPGVGAIMLSTLTAECSQMTYKIVSRSCWISLI